MRLRYLLFHRNIRMPSIPQGNQIVGKKKRKDVIGNALQPGVEAVSYTERVDKFQELPVDK